MKFIEKFMKSMAFGITNLDFDKLDSIIVQLSKLKKYNGRI